MLLSDLCLSHTSGITIEQRGVEDQNWHRGSTRDSDTTVKVNRSKVNLQGHGNIVADSHTSLIFMVPTAIGSNVRWVPQS